MIPPIVTVEFGDTPLVATAIHDGHALREEVASQMALSERDRLREEDPFTGRWTRIAETRLIAGRSRFEMDLNRPREKAVYREPDDAWGLDVWRLPPPQSVLDTSLANYDSFYHLLETVLDRLVARHGRVVVFDLHTYNHRRDGAESCPADPRAYPDVNIGTGTLDRRRWGSLVERFMADLATVDFPGRRLDVRENVCFRGGEMSRWIHATYPDSVCSIAIEFKKFFMDEWTGEEVPGQVEAIERALAATVPGVLRELRGAQT